MKVTLLLILSYYFTVLVFENVKIIVDKRRLLLIFDKVLARKLSQYPLVMRHLRLSFLDFFLSCNRRIYNLIKKGWKASQDRRLADLQVLIADLQFLFAILADWFIWYGNRKIFHYNNSPWFMWEDRNDRILYYSW